MRRHQEYSEREILRYVVVFQKHTFPSLSLPFPRPGITRLSFPYFMSREAVDYVTQAVAMVARHGWRLLPDVSVVTARY